MNEIIVFSVIGGITIYGVIALTNIAKVFPYAYANAKVRSMSGKLLRDKDLIHYCNDSFENIIYNLQKSNFPNLTNLIKGELTMEQVENALKENLNLQYYKLEKLTPNKLKKYIKLLISKQEIENIKTILRSKQNKNLISNLLVPTKNLNNKDWLQLTTKTPNEFKEYFKNKYYYNVLNEYIIQDKILNLEELENKLDEIYFKLLKTNSKITETQKLTKILIDRYNLKQKLNFKTNNWLKGGIIKEITSKNKEELIEELNKTYLKKELENKESIKDIERAIENNLKKHGKNLMLKEPLSPNPILGFYILKKYETQNLRIILSLRSKNYDQKFISKLLITSD